MPEMLKIKPVEMPQFSLELSESFHAILQNGSLEELRQTAIQHGRRTVLFGDFFQVDEISSKQDPIDKHSEKEQHPERKILWEGDFSRVHGIGRAWKHGKMQVTGSVGDCLGEGMSGGEIVVTGNAGDAVGNSMSGGQIVIQGDAGNGVGTSSSGELRGMTGGEIFIHGCAGDRLGARMRRGTIVVQKEVGNHVGKEMLAGSILLFGSYRGQPGIGMKRGSIVMFQTMETEQKSFDNTDRTFGYQYDYAVTYQPVFLNALLKHLEQVSDFPIEQSLYDAWYHRYSGDMSEGGRGEILARTHPL